MANRKYEYDVFVSHAVEDKLEIADELVEKLKESGVKVWYSGHELRVGYPVDELIKNGLNRSRHGIVILSHNFFSKNWTQVELHVLWSMENEQCRILPVWHKITEQEIREYNPDSARNYGISSEKGIDHVVRKLVHSIRENNDKDLNDHTQKQPLANTISLKPKIFIYGLISLLVATYSIWFFLIRDVPSNNLIISNIANRIANLQKKIINDHEAEMNKKKGQAATIQQIADYYERYEDIKSQYRNEYYFNTGYSEFNFKKNVEPALGLEIDNLGSFNNFGFTYPNIFVIDYLPSPHTMDVKTVLINTQPVKYEIVNEKETEDERYLVEVKYENYIRYLSIELTYSKRSDWIKQREYNFQGTLPKETYRFEKEGGQWVFVGLN